MNNWPHDDTASKNAFYGDFQSKAWASLYLIRIHPPFAIYYDKKPMPSGVLLNKNCAVAMQAAFNDIWEHCGHEQRQVDKAGASDYGGCFNIRRIAGSTGLIESLINSTVVLRTAFMFYTPAIMLFV